VKRIYCIIEKCLSCRSCEIACAVSHSGSKRLPDAVREAPLPVKRIRVESVGGENTPYGIRSIALQCRHCENPLCAQACISGGISKDADTGEIVADPGRCVACWSCIMVCPFGVIVRYEDCHRAVKCDHCAGRAAPACVEACPTRALVFRDAEEIDLGELVGDKPTGRSA
jgi:carbon-monoxide dehydrogenase iron sulfur subunit